jgi:PAS domain S-box-containing protein
VVVAADSTGKIAYAGPAVKDILGFEPEELLGDGWWILTHSHGNLECQRERVAAMARGEVAVSKIPYEEEMEHRDGSKRWILWHDTLAPDGQLIGVGQDITERKRAEEQLQKVIHAVEQSPISVVISDTRGCIEYANAKFIQTTGYSPQEVIGRHVDILESGEMPRD